MRRNSLRDAALARGIERLVREWTRGGVRRLRIRVGGTGVVLHGDAATYHLKQLATHAAFAAVGPPERPGQGRVTLRNEIAVRPSGAGTADDDVSATTDFSGGGR